MVHQRLATQTRGAARRVWGVERRDETAHRREISEPSRHGLKPSAAAAATGWRVAPLRG
jgi:hypothetical protein